MHVKVFLKLKITLKTLSSGSSGRIYKKNKKKQKKQKKQKKTKKTKNPLGLVKKKKTDFFQPWEGGAIVAFLILAKGRLSYITGRGEERARVAFQLWERVELS